MQFCMFMANNTVVSQPFYYHNMTQAITDHAVRFITEKAAQDQPFLYVMVMLIVTPLTQEVADGILEISKYLWFPD